MSKNVYIDVQPNYTRMALVSDGDIVEFNIERNKPHKIVGNIYKGKVENILKGMQAAFVSFGCEKNGFLYVGEMLPDTAGIDEKNQLDIPKTLKINQNDEIMVQVVKEEIGSKGARLTTNISLAGRYLVYMPYMDYIGISRKIEQDDEKEKLLNAVKSISKEKSGGFIIRTAAASASKKDLKNDAKFLVKLWQEIKENYEKAKLNENIYNDGNLVFRFIRDIYSHDIENIYINDCETLNYVKFVLKQMVASYKTKVELYSNIDDMFSHFALQNQIDNIFKKRIPMENGAYLVLDKTEALTVIDVNTGRYVGNDNLESTVFNVNLVAAKEIAKQLRLRDIGGIIIVDFIDMHEDGHKEKVLETLEHHLKKDRIRSEVKGMSGLGLVEITRKKSRNELLSIFTQECPYCGGSGYIESNEYIVLKLRNELVRMLNANTESAALVTVNPALSEYIFSRKALSHDCRTIFSDKRIYILSDSSYHMEKREIKLLNGKVLDLPNRAKLLY